MFALLIMGWVLSLVASYGAGSAVLTFIKLSTEANILSTLGKGDLCE